MKKINLEEEVKRETEFLENLESLSKDQLVSIINKYWLLLKNSAESNMNDKINYRIEEFGRIRMTSVNMLRNLINYHASKTK